MGYRQFSSKILFAVISGFAIFLSGCLELGVQGGDVPEKFGGIDAIYAVSPTSIKITWTLNKRFTKYLVYAENNNTAVKEETFQSTLVSSLVPFTTYRFSVSGVEEDGNEEIMSGFTPVTTFPNFVGIGPTDLSLAGPTTVNITWHSQGDVVRYNIYSKKEGQNWNFATTFAQVDGTGTYQAVGLDEGTQYCFYVVASYQDGTSEPSTSNLAAVNSSAPCITTTSDLTGLPTVSLNAVIPGSFPWYTAAGGQPDMTIDVFDLNTNARVATRVGNGPFRSFNAQTPGYKKYYGLVSQMQGSVLKRAKIDLEIKDYTGQPQDGAHIRALKSTNAVTPRLVSGGKGIQALGSQLAKGDFNCDGIPDLAASAPKSTPYVHSNHISEMGAVVVYYGESYVPAGTTSVLYRLKTDALPSTTAIAPNPQLIYYPVNVSSFMFGSKVVSGNFNGDCKKFDPVNPANSSLATCESLFSTFGDAANPTRVDDMKLIYRCDDLAIAINPVSNVNGAAESGGVFVMFGDPNSGIVSGSGATNYGINEPTCDPVSATCRAARLNHHSGSVLHFGKSLATGDINNDGFEDLIVGATTNAGMGQYYGRVTVLRGSDQGIFPTSSINANVDVQAESATVYGVGAVAMGSNAANALNFAFSVAAVPNSRTCQNLSVAPLIKHRLITMPVDSGFDFTKCADLIVGDPSRSSNRGSIVSCRANFSATAIQDVLTQRKITSWTCQEHWPNGLEASAYYGYSLLGVANQNGYPLLQIPSSTAADIGGALFVGAPWAEVPDAASVAVNGTDAGKVFGYYATPGMKNLNGIQGVLGIGAHTVQSNMGVPCDRKNENVSGNRCHNQVIYNSSPQNSELFGYTIGSASDSKLDAIELPMLLIGAPFRDVPGVSSTIADGGAIFAYRGDQSVLGAIALTRIESSACVGSDCNYFSGGVNPFGPSMLYNRNSTPYARLGTGKAVGDNYFGDTSPSEVDVITSAPVDSSTVEENGVILGYQAASGFPPTQEVADFSIIDSISKELNYRFEQAKVVGDLNGDGYDDVIARIKIGTTRVETIVYYGSSSGLIITPAPSVSPAGLQPKIIFSSLDNLLGDWFFPIGDVNGDNLRDVLFIGTNASYVYYGSLTGLVSNTEPSVSPVGKNPLKFGILNLVSDGFMLNAIHGLNTRTPPTYDVSNQAVAFGDYNGDGYGDFAVGIDSSRILPTSVDVSGLNNSINAARRGRVLVFYGSPKGPQTGTGGSIRRVVNSISTAVADVVAKDPCSPDPLNVTLMKCYVQMIGPSSAAANTSSQFGWALASAKSFENSTLASGLLIGDPNANSSDGEVYYLRGGYSGLQVLDTSIQTISASNPGGANRFGYLIATAGDINKDTFDDVIISAPVVTGGGANRAGIYALYGSNVAGVGQFKGVATFASTPPTLNALNATAGAATPQWIMPADLTADTVAQFGYGVSSAGDFNKDGYMDVIVNVAHGNYELDVLKPEAGYAVIYFGSQYGLRSNFPLSTNPRCYGLGTTDEICEPFMFYVPNNAAYENTYISNSAAGDINGDGNSDVMIGVFGRNHPSGLAFSSGEFYVLY